VSYSKQCTYACILLGLYANQTVHNSEKFVVPEPPAKKALRRKRWESADIAQQRGVRRLEQILLEGFTPGTAAADTEGSAEGASTSVIPQFLQRLYLTLPRHSGATADVDALLEGLATAVLPDKATVTGVADAAAAATDDDVDIDMDDAAGASATVDSTIGEHHDVSVDVAGTAVAGVGGAADIDSAAHAQHQQQQQQQQQTDHMQHSTAAAAAAAGGSSSGHTAYSNGGAMPHQQQQQQQQQQQHYQQQQQQRNGSHKRRRNGDSDDEYDDDNEGASGSHKRPLHDVFRQRQLAKLERAS
jgi:hypothetical protein